jgi:hypothetical protein
MTTSYTNSATAGSQTAPGAQEHGTETTSGVSRVRVQASQRARQAGQAVRSRPVPAAAGVATIAGAVAAVLLRRRAKARSARKRWLPGFLQR